MSLDFEIPSIEDVIASYSTPCILSVESDHIVLGNIRCVGSDGKVFESYGKLGVNKDIQRNSDGSQIDFTPYGAVAYFEKNKMFLPSLALTCNTLKTLYDNRTDKEVRNVLMQYKDKGNGIGWHAQNTLVDWDSSKIVHYPLDSDFPKYGGNAGINLSKRIEKSFKPKGFKDMLIEDALKLPKFKAFLQDLTGLEQPETLAGIGKFFSKPARIWTNSSGVRAVWLGCGNSSFCIFADYNLSNDSAARGVALEEKK